MKFKNICKKISEVLRVIFGWGIYVSLIAGGLTAVGFVVAMCIGGNLGGEISQFIYDEVFTVLTYIATSMVVLGLVIMYLNGEVALTSAKKKKQ